ncbi:MAG: hypothetical protein U1E55_13050 [Paracoccus sp. (in: a-proteobacteria)]
MSAPAPDMIPGRVPHRQARWYRVLAVIAAGLIALMIGVTCIDVSAAIC